MFNGHKSKINFEAFPLCGVCKGKKAPSCYSIECNRFKKEREALRNVTTEELLACENKISVKETLSATSRHFFGHTFSFET